MLLQELKDDKNSWTDYTMEETQVELDVADLILEHLV